MEFREFNVGDVVIVVNEPYKNCPFSWADQMTSMCGATVTIKEKRYVDRYNTYRYRIQEDDGDFAWCGNCFLPFDGQSFGQSLRHFRIGDKVCASVNGPDGNDNIHIGDTGTVCIVSENNIRIGVEWENHVCGHDCDGACEYGFGWWVDNTSIELDELNDVDITDDSLLHVIGEGA